MKNGSKVVLVAEDDDLIREAVADFLFSLGHVVLQVCDAAQAIEMIRESSHTIDLLFTDVQMPGTMDGIELALLVSAAWPLVQVIITSGQVKPTPEQIPSRSRFIPKPYTCATLDEAIKALFLSSAPRHATCPSIGCVIN